MEQRQLAWLITMRSQVRVLVPQPRKKDCRKVVLFSWFVGQDENRTAKPRFDNKELTQVLAPSKRRRYMREGAIVLVPQPEMTRAWKSERSSYAAGSVLLPIKM